MGADGKIVGLAILVGPRLEVLAEDQSRIEDITHRRGAKALKQTRICAHLTLRLRDGASDDAKARAAGDLDVFNTHMSLPGPFYPEFWSGPARMGFGPNQLHEAQRLVSAIERRRRSPRVVLMGDFNIAPEDRDVHDPVAWAGQIHCTACRLAYRIEDGIPVMLVDEATPLP